MLTAKGLSFPADVNDPRVLSSPQVPGRDCMWWEEQLFLLRGNNSSESGSLGKSRTDSTNRKKKKRAAVEQNLRAHFLRERKEKLIF